MKFSTHAIIITTILFAFTAASDAATWEVEFNYRSGKADTIDEEEEVDLDYSFNQSTLKIKREISPLWDYSITLNQGIKRYSEEPNLNNSNLKIKNGLIYISENDKEKTSRAFDFDYQNKIFENDPYATYSRLKLKARASYKQKNSYKILASGGYSYFHCANITKEVEHFIDGKMGFEKYLLGENLIIDGYSRAITSTRTLFGTQMVNKIGTSAKFTLPYLSSVRAALKSGFRNSREEEELKESDINYDYNFTELSLASEHPIVKRLNARISYQTSTKTYVSGNYDNTGYTAGLSLKYRPIKNFYLRTDYSYREKKYSDVTSLSHLKNYYSLAATYRIKNNWGIKAEITEAFYLFPSSTDKDRTDFSASIAADKYISKNSKVFLEGKYRFKDYKTGDNQNLSSWKIGINLRQ